MPSGRKCGRGRRVRPRSSEKGAHRSDGFNAHDQFWGGNPGSAGALSVLQAGQTVFKEPFSPATHDLASRAPAIGTLIVRQALLSEEDHLGASNCTIRERIFIGAPFQLLSLLFGESGSIR